MKYNKNNVCGIRIRELRKKKNLTQNQLADLLYISRSAIMKYETGRQLPPIDRIYDIAEIFNVSVDYLYGRIDFNPPITTLNKTFYNDLSIAELIAWVI